MDELKPCPFCGQKAERTPINGSVCCPVRGIGKHTDYLRPDVWQNRPIEDALQKRVEELETHIKEAVKEIAGLSIYDIPEQGQEDDAKYEMKYKIIDILRKHGLVEDK